MEEDLSQLSFEAAMAELEQIVARLEAGELSLDESLALFERGQSLAAHCSGQLEEAAMRVEQLTDDGEIVQLGSTEGA
jgi:exodeoxyribonuclease VII small subunit